MFTYDVLINSKSEEEHDEHLRIIFETLRKNQLYAKFSKCEFCLENVAFLGHYVSKEGPSMDPIKIQFVSEWCTPKNVLDIRNFLGLDGYYRSFVRDFSKIARLMTNLMKKESKFEWSDKCEEAFQILKERLILAPVLTLHVSN